jgi:hypothetical protein
VGFFALLGLLPIMDQFIGKRKGKMRPELFGFIGESWAKKPILTSE